MDYEFKYTTETVELVPNLRSGFIQRWMQDKIKEEALLRLSAVDPLFKHIMEIKIVMNPRRNFINVVIKKEYIPLIFFERHGDVFYCFFLSDKLEPFAIITALHIHQGRLIRLSEDQLDDLKVAVDNFKKKFGITMETYHYTSLAERETTEKDFKDGNVSRSNKSHSRHWHLKMRVATGMCQEKLPILKMLNLNNAREKIEPVKYNYSRETVTWDDIFRVMKDEIENASK